MQTARIIAVSGTAVVTAALILQAVGCATAAWMILSVDENTFGVGLWKVCFIKLENNCTDNKILLKNPDLDFSVELRTCQVFSILGIVFLTATIALAILQIVLTFLEHDVPRVITVIPLATAGLALVAILVSVIVWAVKIHKPFAEPKPNVQTKIEVDFGYSFALSIVAGILGIMGAALFVVGVNKRVD